MAEIVLKIPKEFEQDFNADKFRESFIRVLIDCRARDYGGVSGNYEYETLEMLVKAFDEAVVLPKGHGDLVDVEEIKEYLDNIQLELDGWGKTESAVEIAKAKIGLDSVSTIIEANKEEKDESVS